MFIKLAMKRIAVARLPLRQLGFLCSNVTADSNGDWKNFENWPSYCQSMNKSRVACFWLAV